MERRKIVIIAGPTASGKSRLAIETAEAIGAEVINADSMQVYRYMDIGTAKPNIEERRKVAHHLIDIVDPDQDYTAADFKKDAASAIEEITKKGRRIIVAGGTGLYIKALTSGLFSAPPADKALRRELLLTAESLGPGALYKRLQEVDPAAAARIHPNNITRVVRALEVYAQLKRPISELHDEHAFSEEPYETLKIGLLKEREALYKDIDERVDQMISAGLIEETRGLLARGYSQDLKPMRALGYKEVLGYLAGQTSLEEAIRLIKRNTRHFAKRQLTWFRKDAGIRWFHSGQKKDIIDAARGFLN